MKQLFTLCEFPRLLDFPDIYTGLSLNHTWHKSARLFNKALLQTPPDIVIAEFIYGFGNNYAGVNISNLDVSFYALRRHAPDAKIILIADKADLPHTPKLEALFNIHAVLAAPVVEAELKEQLLNLT